jgi:hypothetical protein
MTTATQPVLRCPHMREVSDPFAVRSRLFEAAVTQIESTPARAALRACCRINRSIRSTTPQPSGEQILPDTPGPVGSIVRQKAGAKLGSIKNAL